MARGAAWARYKSARGSASPSTTADLRSCRQGRTARLRNATRKKISDLEAGTALVNHVEHGQRKARQDAAILAALSALRVDTSETVLIALNWVDPGRGVAVKPFNLDGVFRDSGRHPACKSKRWHDRVRRHHCVRGN